MNSTRPAIVASRSLVRGQPTERQSGRGSLRPGGRSEAEGETGADRRTTRRLPPALKATPTRGLGGRRFSEVPLGSVAATASMHKRPVSEVV
jgi:hypothetical protein